MKKIKKYIGEILLLVGSFCATYNLFNFNVSRGCGSLSLNIGAECGNPVAYYYDETSIIFISISTMLIIIGILIIKRR